METPIKTLLPWEPVCGLWIIFRLFLFNVFFLLSSIHVVVMPTNHLRVLRVCHFLFIGPFIAAFIFKTLTTFRLIQEAVQVQKHKVPTPTRFLTIERNTLFYNNNNNNTISILRLKHHWHWALSFALLFLCVGVVHNIMIYDYTYWFQYS